MSNYYLLVKRREIAKQIGNNCSVIKKRLDLLADPGFVDHDCTVEESERKEDNEDQTHCGAEDHPQSGWPVSDGLRCMLNNCHSQISRLQ